MNTKVETASKLDPVKWLLVLLVVGGGIYANAEYATTALVYRMLAGIVVAALAVAIALQTAQGRSAWDLAREARVEIRKVVWPTRQETTQTTLIVVGVVLLVGLMLWGMDSGLSWGVQAIIG